MAAGSPPTVSDERLNQAGGRAPISMGIALDQALEGAQLSLGRPTLSERSIELLSY